MSLSPLTVALGPITVALFAVLTLIASMGPDNSAARPVESNGSSSISSSSIEIAPSVTIPRPGVSGDITSGPEAADVDHDGVPEAVFGAERGFYRISNGEVAQHIPTSTEVRDFAFIGDVTGDGVDDVALALGDTTFPNIRAYDSVTGEELWTYVPAQDVFLDNLMWTSQETFTFDLLGADIDGDGSSELLATSGYRLYALNGSTGAGMWRYEWLDNLWKVVVVGDLDGDGKADLVVGSQDGYLIAVSGADGARIWQRQVAEPFPALDEKGAPWKSIDQSIWDIALAPGSSDAVIVTSEDGSIRRIDLSDGETAWERELITQPEALLSEYYRRRGGYPSSPGDRNFFSLRTMQVADITGDGADDILATAYLGASDSQDSRNQGMFALDSISGSQVWRNSTVDITEASRIDVFDSPDGPLAVVPSSTPVHIDLRSGQPVSSELIGLPAQQGSNQRSGAALLSLGGGDFMYASASGDILGSTGGSTWSIPRISQSDVLRGDFTGEPAEDILVRAGAGAETGFGVETRYRLVYAVDGSSGGLAWEYLVPYDLYEATGGIAGVRLVADLTGDGKQDVIGYMQDARELNGGNGQGGGESSRVIVLDGATGETVLNAPSSDADYYGAWEQIANEDPALMAQVRARVADRIGGDLSNEWQGEAQRLRGEFELGLSQTWADYRQQQVLQYISENGVEDVDEQALRAQNEQEMDASWSITAADRNANFENALAGEVDALRTVGADESLVTLYEDRRRSDFAAQLEQDRLNLYAQWLSDFESRLASGEFGGSAGQAEFEAELDVQQTQVQQMWRDEFEAGLDSQRTSWIDDRTGGALDTEAQMELQNLRSQLQQGGDWLRVDKRIVSVDVISFPMAEPGVALLVAGPRDLSIISLEGETLWTRSYGADVYNTPFGGPEVDMAFGLPVDSQRPVRAVPDRNGDGTSDLRIITGRTVMFAESSIVNGELRFTEAETVTGPAGTDGNGAVTEISDLSLDGVPDIALVLWRDNALPQARIVDGVTGATLLEADNFDENSVTLTPSADFNGDSRPDVIMFERWVEGKEGPRVRILAAGSGAVLWEFSEFRDQSLLDQASYSGPIVPAVAVDDLTGDGMPEVALVRHLTWQAGGSVDVYDITHDKLISQVITEASNPNSTQEKRWHPGLLASQVGDLNGDGISEIAFVTAYGDSFDGKELRLSVADLASSSVIADFSVTGTNLVSLDGAGKFGLAGLSGDLFMLDVNSELKLDLPSGESSVSSPLTLEWDGAAPGSFNQVYVDGIEVARTNGEAVELNLRSGEHTVAVRSLDPSGRGVIVTSQVSVSKSQLARNLALVMALLVMAGVLWVPGRRIFEKSKLRMATSG